MDYSRSGLFYWPPNRKNVKAIKGTSGTNDWFNKIYKSSYADKKEKKKSRRLKILK